MLKAVTADALRNINNSYRPSIIWAALWVIIALVANSATLMNIDCSWLLYAAERMVDGAVPYVDFYEVNPPLILWINVIPAALSHMLGVDAVTLLPFFVVALSVFSLWLALHEIKRHELLAPPYYGNIVFGGLAQLLLGCSFLIFGQREHIFLILALPYFIQSSYFTREAAWSFRQALIAVMAGLGFAIKPYFVIIWLAGEIFSAVSARSKLILFRRTNLAIGITIALYCVSVWLFTPQYFTNMLPLLLLTYGAFGPASINIFLKICTIAAIYLLPALAVRLEPKQRLFIMKLACWFVAAAITAWIQHKGWLNHYYPALFFGAFIISSLLAIFLRQWATGAFTLNRKYFALGWALAFVAFILPAIHLATTRSAQNTNKDYINKLGAFIAQTYSQGKPLYVMSFDLVSSFPAVQYLPVKFPFHFHSLWDLPAILVAEKSGDIASMAQARKFTIDAVTQDFTAFKPAVVVVDNNSFANGLFKNFDFVGYFGHDALFRAQWDHYRKIGEIAVNDVDAGGSNKRYTVYGRIGDNL